MSAAAAVRPSPRTFEIGEKRPIELVVLKDGTIRMREKGRRQILETTVASVYFSAVRSKALSDVRDRQRRATLLARATKGARR